MKRTFESKKDYVAAIHVYEKRREKLRKKYGVTRRTSKNPNLAIYGEQVFRINRKLDGWRNAVRRIDRVNNRLSEINSLLKKFMGISVKNVGFPRALYYKRPEIVIAKRIFFKYCLENGLPARYIALYTNSTSPTPARVRIYFTRSFKTNLYHREIYHEFLDFVKTNL